MGSVYTVSQVTSYIKNMFTQDFALNRVSIKGEVSNCKYHTSGHIYFTLKDGGAQIAAVMFAGQAKSLDFHLTEGQEVIVSGTVDVYERDGRYQLYAKEIKREGRGDLFLRFEKLRDELEEMGMFAAEYKQPIPPYAMKIGVVTAPTGAAVQDIRNISARRNPFVQLILYPALVQGDGAVESIVNGIHALDALGVDVMIVGRGGGSIEDLWAFNEEEVARAIFECETPVISAVGHETDWTIADFVADLRAPTPSAAAELAVFDYAAVEGRLGEIKERMFLLNMQRIQQMRKELEHAKDRLSYLSPEGQLREKRKYAADLEEQLRNRMEHMIELRRHKLALLSERLEGVSPVKKLAQGYSYVTDENGHTLTDAEGVKAGDRVKIRLLKGALEAEVTEVLHER